MPRGGIRPICSVANCSKPHLARGFCAFHYRTIGNPAPICSIEGCQTISVARGWCVKHYTRWQKRRDPNYEVKKKLCLVKGCGKPHSALGMCDMHYARVRTHGHVDACRSYKTIAYLQDVVLPFESNECLLWPFNLHDSGYGRMSLNGEIIQVHRYVCLQTHGKPPQHNFHASHQCGNRQCVNPKHLVWKSPAGNAADRRIHGTQHFGENNKTSKLTREDILEIRQLRNVMTREDLAYRFNVCRSTIYYVLNGTTWGWLK